MFGRPPEGGFLSSRGRGVDGSKGPPRFGAGPNMRAPFVRAVLVVLGAFGGRVCRTFSIRGAARQISSQTYATNLVSSLASNLCASASRPYPEMLPRLYRARLSLLAPNVAYLARLRYLAVENEGGPARNQVVFIK